MIANTPAAWDERAAEPMSWQAAMWSKQGQEARFNAVLRHLNLRSGDRLLDFGCGTGRFRDFLPTSVSYFGHDWSEAMVERARADSPRGLFTTDLDRLRFDHVVAIGPFNLAHEWSKDATGLAMLDLWMRHTERSLIVSLYRGKDPACLSYSPAEAAMWVAKLGVKRWQIDCDYLDNDFLLVMRR